MVQKGFVRSLLPMLSIAISASMTAGCGFAGGELRSGINRYEVGNFNAAARHCGALNGVQGELSDKAHTRYLVYCGLTQYKLGNRDRARQLLTDGADEYESGTNGWLKPRIVNELYRALDDLHGARRERPFTRERTTKRRAPEPLSAEDSASGLR